MTQQTTQPVNRVNTNGTAVVPSKTETPQGKEIKKEARSVILATAKDVVRWAKAIGNVHVTGEGIRSLMEAGVQETTETCKSLDASIKTLHDQAEKEDDAAVKDAYVQAITSLRAKKIRMLQGLAEVGEIVPDQ